MKEGLSKEPFHPQVGPCTALTVNACEFLQPGQKNQSCLDIEDGFSLEFGYSWTLFPIVTTHKYFNATPLMSKCIMLSAMINNQTVNQAGRSADSAG